MATAVHRLTLEVRRSINPPAPEYQTGDWIIDPDIPDAPKRHWVVIGDDIHDYVTVRGSQYPEAYWICSNYDTWHTTPYYVPKTAADRFSMKYEHPEYDHLSDNEHLEFRALWIADEQDAESGRYEVTS